MSKISRLSIVLLFVSLFLFSTQFQTVEAHDGHDHATNVGPFDDVEVVGPEEGVVPDYDGASEEEWIPLEEPGRGSRAPEEVSREAAADDPQLYGSWTEKQEWPAVAIHANLMPDGNVLAWDGYYDDIINRDGWGWEQPVQDFTNVTLWDPVANTHTPVLAELGGNMFCSGHAHLPDGNLFTAGGNVSAGTPRTESHRYDVETQTWTRNPDITNARWYPAVTPLSTGEMLVSSGKSSVPEVFDAETNTWRLLNNANVALPLFPWMHAVSSGNVFLAGPNQTMRELDTSGLGSWTTVGQRDTINRSYGAHAMVDVGKILAVGGGGSSATAVIVDTDSGAVTPTGDLNTGRRQHNATIMADGNVIVTGGNFNGAGLFDEAGQVFSAEIWDRDTEQWTTVASSQGFRQYHSTALLLPDARILSAGGRCGHCIEEANAEIFSPPYLFNADGTAATQSIISSAPDAASYASTITINTSSASTIASAALIKLSSVTHSVNFEQRFIPLNMSQNGSNALSITTPATANIAPPGYYMLFLVDNNGVPSKAHMLKLIDGASVEAVINVTSAESNDTTFWFDGSNSLEASSPIVSYEWEFGDGTTATGQTVRHSYALGGDYTVKLTVTDGANRVDDATIVQTVAEPVNLAPGSAVSQSSDYGTGQFPASIAINGTIAVGSVRDFSHTLNESEPWWEIDLGKVYDLTTISIWNRTDCCSDRLVDFYTFVSETPFTGDAVSGTLAQAGVGNFYHDGEADIRTDVAINRSGRYLRIQLSGTSALQLSEVVIRGDLSSQPNGADALLAEYRFDESPLPTTPNGIADAQGNHLGSGMNGVNSSYAAPAIDSNEGTCRYAEFDGSSQGIVVDYDESLNPRDFTISLWAKVEGGNGNWRSPVSTRYTSPDFSVRKGYNLYASSDNKWQLWTGDGLNSWDILTGPDVVNGEWAHIAATFEASTALGEGRFEGIKRLYVDGVAVEQIGIYEPNEVVDLTIGMLNDTFGFFNGSIDEVRIYNYALPVQQIVALMSETHLCETNEDPIASFGVNPTSTSFEMSFDGSFSNDADGSIVSYDWLFGDGNIGNGATVNHIFPAAGDFTVQLTVTDNDGATDVMTQQVSAEAANTPPVIAAIANQSGLRGSSASIQPSASDADNDALTWTATNLPSGISINSSTGAIAGTFTAANTFNATVYVDDGRGGIDSTPFSWVVAEIDSVAITPLSSLPHQSGVSVPYSAEVTGGNNLTYRWNFGDGSATTSYSSSPNRSHTFANPGRFLVTLTVRNFDNATTNYQFVQAIHAPKTSTQPERSSSIIFNNDEVWNVNPDNRTVTIIDAPSQQKDGEISVGLKPVSLAIAPNGNIWVVNKQSASINIINATTRSVINTLALPRGSQPHGIIFSGGNGYVVLEATGQLLKLNGSTGATISSVDVGTRPRFVSADSDGKLYVTRFITPLVPGETTGTPNANGGGAEIVVVDNMSISDTMLLAHSNAPDTQSSARGIPNYLGAFAIAPDGDSAWVASKQDNIMRGSLRDGNPLTHDSTVRAIASFVDLNGNSEILANRLDFDNAGVASQAAFGSFGNYAFITLETNREIVILDTYARAQIGTLQVGRAPQGMALSDDGLTLYVHNFTDRSVSVVNMSALMGGTSSAPFVNGTIGTVANETLTAEVLNGKQMFYDAHDEQVALESYVSCASCHNEGDDDGRVWDFTGFDEGLRNTISLVGRGGAEHGMLHWTANFDEFHDFEGQIRAFALGDGLMSDSDFAATSNALGAPKAGLSADLDAMAAYMQSLGQFGDSPERNSNGTLSAEAILGSQIFETQSCAACHGGIGFTDSASAQRHDVGTIKAHSGERIGGLLDGFDTPTLRGLWMTAPYLHDGSAATVADAISAHDGVTLNSAELNQLAAYLLQIDDSEAAPANGGGSCEENGLRHEWWDNITGVEISQMRNSPLYPNNPNGSNVLTSFEIPANVKENYGVRLRGYIIAPETGNYTFWIASDDHGELWLSTDDSADNASLIASVDSWAGQRDYDKFASQQSAAIALRAGEKYYVEALMKEYGGGDNLSVAWTTPSDARSLISGDVLCVLESLGDAPSAVVSASATSGQAPLAVNFDSAGSADSDGSIVSYEWDFGDGATASGTAASHSYSQPGVFNATLTTTDDDGLTAIATTTILVSGDNASCDVSGSLLMETWTDVNGTAISDLTGSANYPFHPDASSQISDFVIGSNENDRYGVRVRGYIVAPSSGSYTFWISSDDAGSLLLSNTADPAGAVEIASVNGWTFSEQWTKYASQESAEMTLVAGQRYYIEALMKEGSGGDNLAVAWTPSGGSRHIIPSPNLCSFVVDNAPPTAVLNVSATAGTAPLNVSFTSAGSADSDGSIASYLWTFHDGTTANTANAAYVYNEAGVYNVNLTVTDSDGMTATDNETIVVVAGGGAGACTLPGIVNREVWVNMWNGEVSELLANSNYPLNPNRNETQSGMTAPSNIDDAYAVRMRAYLVAPATGSYTFYVASDNEGQLLLSTTSDPADAVQIAQNWWSPEQNWNDAGQSVSITLVEGEAYYIEGLHAASWSSDYYAVAWTTPGSSTPELIPTEHFCAFDADAAAGGRDSGDRLRSSYSNLDLLSSPLVTELPLSLHDDVLIILQSDQALRDRTTALRDTFVTMLNGETLVYGEFVYDVTVLYNDFYAAASPELQAWMAGKWSQLPISDFSLVGRTSPLALSDINEAATSTSVPTAVGFSGLTLGNAISLAGWIAFGVIAILSVSIVLRGRRQD